MGRKEGDNNREKRVMVVMAGKWRVSGISTAFQIRLVDY